MDKWLEEYIETELKPKELPKSLVFGVPFTSGGRKYRYIGIDKCHENSLIFWDIEREVIVLGSGNFKV